MIDTEKMKALAARHREEAELAEYANRNTYAAFMRESADAIDTLLAALEAAAADKRNLRTALVRIQAIPCKLDGGDWDEIEEARSLNGSLATDTRDQMEVLER